MHHTPALLILCYTSAAITGCTRITEEQDHAYVKLTELTQDEEHNFAKTWAWDIVKAGNGKKTFLICEVYNKGERISVSHVELNDAKKAIIIESDRKHEWLIALVNDKLTSTQIITQKLTPPENENLKSTGRTYTRSVSHSTDCELIRIRYKNDLNDTQPIAHEIIFRIAENTAPAPGGA